MPRLFHADESLDDGLIAADERDVGERGSDRLSPDRVSRSEISADAAMQKEQLSCVVPFFNTPSPPPKDWDGVSHIGYPDERGIAHTEQLAGKVCTTRPANVFNRIPSLFFLMLLRASRTYLSNSSRPFSSAMRHTRPKPPASLAPRMSSTKIPTMTTII